MLVYQRVIAIDWLSLPTIFPAKLYVKRGIPS
jgi:hypothetical protein